MAYARRALFVPKSTTINPVQVPLAISSWVGELVGPQCLGNGTEEVINYRCDNISSERRVRGMNKTAEAIEDGNYGN